MNRRSFIKIAASASAALILPACQSAPAATRTPRPTVTLVVDRRPSAPVTLPDTEFWDMKSKVNGETYRIFVKVPKGQEQTPLPVIYLTDGNGNFHLGISLHSQLVGDQYIKPAIIVAVGYRFDEYAEYEDMRMRDFSNSALPAGSPAQRDFPLGTGGAQYFLRFLVEELKPLIDAKYQTQPEDATLVGHSMGGLFALYTLFQATSPFRRYVIGSPSIWWGNQSILNDLTTFCNTHTDLPAHVYISVGDKEESAFMVAPMHALADKLESYAYPSLKLTRQVFEDETHLSVIPFFISRGLRAVYQ